MGFFDEKVYLTGDSGLVRVGDTFWIHDAEISGTQRDRRTGESIHEACLTVSKHKDNDPIKAYTTGRGIVNQVQRMEAKDRAGLPWFVRLVGKDVGQGNTMFLIERADQPAEASPGQTPGEGSDF